MATGNLFLVTQTLTRLLDLNVRALLTRAGLPTTLNVSAMPPERVGSEANTLNLHLYHVVEDAHYRNDPPLGSGGTPVARQPLGLSLYYILTAHHQINDVFDAQTQQMLFGLAMKTMHDHPRLTEYLAIAPGIGPTETVMPSGLIGRDNQFDVALRPLTPEESMSFWHADDSATTRLSAYYEVRPVFIEPEPVTGISGIVFDLGLFVSAGAAPRIDHAAGLLQFTPPVATGLPLQLIETRPARATLAPGLPEGPVNRITLGGSALAGDGSAGSARIVLRSQSWRALVPPVRAARVDPALNPLWAVSFNERRAVFDMQGTLNMQPDGGPVISLETTPGLYAVSIETIRTQETANGTVRTSVSESNQIAFSLGARILLADPPDGAGRIAIHVVNLFDMLSADLDVQLAVDGIIYPEVAAFTGVPANDRGHFRRIAGAVQLHPLASAVTPGAHPVRLVVNGAESQPFWIILP
jgi:Pvc16 N-terminal domain